MAMGRPKPGGSQEPNLPGAEKIAASSIAAAHAADFGLALRARFEQTGVMADIDAAVEYGQRSVDLTQSEDPDRAFHLSCLANTLQIRYEYTGDLDDLASAVVYAEAAVDEGNRRSPQHAIYLSNLGNGLRALAEHTGVLDHLDRAVSFGRAAVTAAHSGDRMLPMYRANLSLALRVRFDETGEPADLAESIDVGRLAVCTAAVDDPNRPAWLSNLGGAFRTRYEWYGDDTDLDAAVSLGREGVDTADPEDPDAAMYLSNLALALLCRFDRSGAIEDISGAVNALRQAVDATDEDDPDLPMYLANTGLVLRSRFERFGDRADLDAAVEAGWASVAQLPDDHADQVLYKGNLSGTLCSRYTYTSNPADLDEAVRVGLEAAQNASEHDARYLICLANVGMALRERFFRTGATSDLDEAIDMEQRAVRNLPDDHPQQVDRLSNLALSLRARYERFGLAQDLDEAIRVARSAVRAAHSGYSRRATLMSNLATALHARYERTSVEEDLADCVRLSRDAVAACDSSHPDIAMYQHNLSLALRDRFQRSGVEGDLGEAVELGYCAVLSSDDQDLMKPTYTAALASALIARFGYGGDRADAKEARRLAGAALATTPDGHPSRADFLTTLAEACHAHGASVADCRELTQALGYVRQAAQCESSPAADRIDAAYRWGQWAWDLGEHEHAAAGYTAAVGLLPLLAWPGLDRETQEDTLAAWSGLVSQAVSCLAAIGQADRAVELAERGRSVLWAHTMRLRSPLHQLDEAEPELAAELRTIRARLDQPAEWSQTRRLLRTSPNSTSGETLVERRRLARRWDDLVAHVRSLDGFTGFPESAYSSPVDTDLQGTVIVPNTSRLGCHAILIRRGEAMVVDLPEAVHEEVLRRCERWLDAVDPDRDDEEPETVLLDSLAWLWRAVVGPSLRAAGLLDKPAPQERPRVWWLPIGPLSLLPLHAAGDVLDDASAHVVSSYAPTLQALARARRPRSPSQVTQLVVALPHLPEGDTLPAVAREVTTVTELSPAKVLRRLLDAEATAGAVRTELGRCAWVHFACHAEQDHRHPADSAFLLWDWATEPLTLGDLAALRLEDAELAVLSACQTSMGSSRLPDEATHLAAAMQIIGYRHVVGTLWAVPDAAAPRLARALYPGLLSDGEPDASRTALALDEAVRMLRDRYPRDPRMWAAYVHLGP